MASEVKTAVRKHVVEIRVDRLDGSVAGARSYSVPLGAEIRIPFSSAVIPGAAHNYAIDADGSVEAIGLDAVEEYGMAGSVRTDVVLSARSLGDGTAKVRTLDDNDAERDVAFFSFNVTEAREEA